MQSKNILVISDCPTHPTNAGNRSCLLSYCCLLKEMGYNIYFLYISLDQNKQEQMAMRDYWGKELFIYKTPMIQRFLQKVTSKYYSIIHRNFFSLDFFCPWFISHFVQRTVDDCKIDSIIINYIWLSKVLEKVNVSNKVIFTHDVFSYKYLKGKSKWFSFSPKQESKALMRCDKILAIQENEAIYFQYLAPLSKVYTVFSPYHFHSQDIVKSLNLLFFSGGNEHNLNGIRSFLTTVFPKVRNEFPDVQLLIGGSICKILQYDNLDEAVILKGCYDDPADFYKQGDVVINPVYEGTGLKIKTFEALSYGKIVLAHPHSFEGVFKKESVPMFKCSEAEDYLEYMKDIKSELISREIVRQKCEDYIIMLNEEIGKQYKAALAF